MDSHHERERADPHYGVSYELSYVIDECEHVRPEAAGTSLTRRSPCSYSEGSPRPRFLREGEAQVAVQGFGEYLTASATGSNDTLTAVYLVSGRLALASKLSRRCASNRTHLPVLTASIHGSDAPAVRQKLSAIAARISRDRT